MRRRSKWAAIPACVVVAGIVAAGAAYEGASSQQPTQQPAAPQPAAPQPAVPQPAVPQPAVPQPAATPVVPASDTVITHDPGSPGWGYHGGSSAQGYSPPQPINFPHPKHVKGLGMNCVYCHYAAYKSPDPGLPAVGTCMGCHLYTYTLAKKPEIVKLTEYWNKKQPIPWVRIHQLPEYVHFPHMRHVNAGVTCQTCHGQVQEMYRVYQYSSLNMGWCVSCHVNGYNPVDGDRAAGSARELGPPGAASRPNLTLPPNLPKTPGGTPILQAAGLSIGPPLTEPVHRARYDCSTCHF